MKQEVLYYERQFMMTWVFVVVLLAGVGIPVMIFFVKGVPPIVIFMSLMLVVIFLLFATMQTKVTKERLIVTFGLLPLIGFAYPLTEIVSVEARSYEPVAEFGGWGIKGSKDNRALNMRGTEGVQLELTSAQGSRWKLLIGSQNPRQLQEAIRTAKGN